MGTLGQVVLERGNFVLPNEKVQDHEQQPQFLPRLYWPWEYDAMSSQARPALNLDIDWLNADAVSLLYNDVMNVYPRLEPMPPYAMRDRVYDGCQWSAHLAVAHNLFHKSLQNGEDISAMEMTVLVRIATYGMFNSTTFFAPFTVDEKGDRLASRLDPSEVGQPRELRWRIPEGGGSSSRTFSHQDRDWSRRRLWTRRWVIVPVLHARRQWSMTIFDRCKGQLYVFDCGDDKSKAERVKSAVRVWVVLLKALGQPYGFVYFAPHVTRQLDERDSGLLCVAWLMETLRNQVGRPMTSRDDNVRRVNILVGSAPPRRSCRVRRRVDYTTSLPLHDWVRRDCGTPNAQLMAVRKIIRVVVANELGLRNHRIMTQRCREWSRPEGEALKSAFKLLKEAATELMNTGGTMEKDAFFTGHGGPQFALPMRRAVLPYGADAPRRHTKHKLRRTRHKMRITAEELNAWAATPFHWPDDNRSRSSTRLPRTSPTPDLEFAMDGRCDASRPGVDLFRNLAVPDMRITRRGSRLYEERRPNAAGDNGSDIW